MTLTAIKSAFEEIRNPEKAIFFQSFFKTQKGGYGEGDVFLGLTVPHLRKISNSFFKILPLDQVDELLRNPVHEYRLCALFIMVLKFQKSKKEEEKEEIFDLYLRNTRYINNWDLVDSSADKIVGAFLFEKDRSLLKKLANSKNLWEQRISIIATFYFIRRNEYNDTITISEILLQHPHDLIHKAVGWMLREIGKRNYEMEFEFLLKHYKQMPRTMLRYAIEKFPEDVRQDFLKGRI